MGARLCRCGGASGGHGAVESTFEGVGQEISGSISCWEENLDHQWLWFLAVS